MPCRTFPFIFLLALLILAAGCGDVTLPGPTDDPVSAEMPTADPTPTGEPKPAECGEQALADRQVCSDDAYADYIASSMTCGGTGTACENSECPATCMAAWVEDLEACDIGWPECAETSATDVLPEGFACLAERYECQAELGECTDAGLAACTAEHYACALEV